MPGFGALLAAPKLSDEAYLQLAIDDSPYLRDMMLRKDQREQELKTAQEIQRAYASNPLLKPEFTNPNGSPELQNQITGFDSILAMEASGIPALQQQAAKLRLQQMEALNQNYNMTNAQKDAYSAAPNDAQGFQRIMQMQTDPAYAVNVQHANRLAEMAKGYGYDVGRERLKFQNASNLSKQGYNQDVNMQGVKTRNAIAQKSLDNLGQAPEAQKVSNVIDDYSSKLSASERTKFRDQMNVFTNIADALSYVTEGSKNYNPDAFGGENILFPTFGDINTLDKLDPNGIPARASTARLSAEKIKEMSGTAVTASELPRLKPFLPTRGDNAATIKKKLNGFMKEYASILKDYGVPDEAIQERLNQTISGERTSVEIPDLKKYDSPESYMDAYNNGDIKISEEELYDTLRKKFPDRFR